MVYILDKIEFYFHPVIGTGMMKKNKADNNQKVKCSRREILRDVAEDLASIPGHLHRVVRTRLVRVVLANGSRDVTPLHHEILHLLEEEGKLHPAEIGRRLQVAKAQMTKLINKLVELKLVERAIDPLDRRVYNISLTEEGKRFEQQKRKSFNQSIATLMSSLSDAELQELSASLRKIHETLFKME